MPEDKDFELDDLDSFSFDEVPLEGDESRDASGKDTGDEFGVWVKSAPEDVTEGLPGLDDLSGLDDLPPMDDLPSLDEMTSLDSLPDMDDIPEMNDLSSTDDLPDLDDLPDMDNLPSLDLPEPISASETGLPEEDFLSTEELASLDDQFDFVTVSDEPLEGEADPLADELPTSAVAGIEDVSASEFDEVSLDDFVTFDDVSLEDTGSAMPPASADTGPVSSDEEFNEEFLDIDIDINDEIDDEELEILEGAQVARENTAVKAESFAAESVDLSEFGDFGEVDEFETASEPSIVQTVSASPPAEADDFDVDLSADDLTLDGLGSFEETILDDSLDPHDSTDMDHIMALEENLTSGIRPADAPPSGDLATLILSKIEQELSSIKKEIHELKRDFSVYRDQGPSGVPAPAAEEPVVEEGPRKGFFDEEDDETIALTGDELDNILQTATISEADDSGESLEDDLIVTDAAGNLPAVENSTLPDEAEVHVTDEEFFAGTSLEDEDEQTSVFTSDIGGVPESIELEEEFPEGLEDDKMVDLLSGNESEESLDTVEEFSLDESVFDTAVESAGVEESEAESEPEPEPVASQEPTVDRMTIPFDDEPVIEEENTDVFEPVPTESDEQAFSMPVENYRASPVAEPEAKPPTVTLPADPPIPGAPIPERLRDELKAVLAYMDKLLVSLPDDKIQEFAESEHFEVYKKLFEELGLES